MPLNRFPTVTYVPGPFCYLCIRSVPEGWGEGLVKSTSSLSTNKSDVLEKSAPLPRNAS